MEVCRQVDPPSKLSGMRESALLQHIYQSTSRVDRRVLIGPGDDMGMVQLTGTQLLAAVDQLIDGRHVIVAKTPLSLVGRKAMTRSLSDIAAMAAAPVACLVAATLPPDFGEERANELFDAMRDTARQYGCPLIGGDIAFHKDASYPMVCSVTVLAEPVGPRVITRGGAKIGDTICVTGPMGGSLEPDGLGRHLTFEPRIELAQQIASHYGERLHAMIDISDGLGRDASHIAKMSDVQIRLNASSIPCNPGCDWRRALRDGEDYELCFAVAGELKSQIGGSEIHPVGNVVELPQGGPHVVIKDRDLTIAASDMGWEHRKD
jgi:thiamine-monophosphate kinase